MKKLNLFLVTTLIATAPIFINGCDKKDEVGRDKGTPNNVEDNYTRDNDDPNRAKVNPPRESK